MGLGLPEIGSGFILVSQFAWETLWLLASKELTAAGVGLRLFSARCRPPGF